MMYKITLKIWDIAKNIRLKISIFLSFHQPFQVRQNAFLKRNISFINKMSYQNTEY